MGLSFKNHINRDLMRMAKKHKTVSEKSLLVAAKAMAEALERNTPKQDDRNGQKDRKERPPGTHMKENVVFTLDENDSENVLIGYSKEVSWRVHFVELGTIKQPPQAFLEKTHNENIKEVIKLLEKELKKGLGL